MKCLQFFEDRKEAELLEMKCSDCPASLACVAGRISFGIWCKGCNHVFVKVGQEGHAKEEMKIPWQLRHLCKHNHGKPNANSDVFPDEWGLNRCRECEFKIQVSQPIGQQKIFMTKEQFNDIAESLKHFQGKAIEHSGVGPALLGTPDPSIHGIPVKIVPEHVLGGKDKMMFIGSDEEKSVVVTGIGDATKPLMPGEMKRAISEAQRQQKEREKKRRKEESDKFLGVGIFNEASTKAIKNATGGLHDAIDAILAGAAHDLAADVDRQ
jgi:hypothetical protein